MNNLRNTIEQELTRKNISCSAQVLNTIYHTALYSYPEFAGDSDSLLLGLFKSGSYTINALLDSGVDINALKKAVDIAVGIQPRERQDTVHELTIYDLDHDIDIIENLFSENGVLGHFLLENENSLKEIETADLLNIAISLKSLDTEYHCIYFPYDLIKNQDYNESILKEIQEKICYLIEFCIEVISRRPEYSLRYRKRKITQSEEDLIRKELTYYIDLDDASWVIRLTDNWIQKREITLDKHLYSIQIFDTIVGELRFGSSMFLSSGGNHKSLNIALKAAKRYAPERDNPILGLFEREGRIYIRHYSYRSSAKVAQSNPDRILSFNAEVPLSLTSSQVIQEFEKLINNYKISENKLQRFLEHYPELLHSLGYAACKPQIILREKEKKDLIPDFILQRPGNNGFDILDLKLPNRRIAVHNPYPRISHEITKAIGQLRAYRNFFDNPKNVSNFYKMYGLEVLNPELIVVIGRSSDYISIDERREIDSQSRDIKIINYDMFLDYAKSRSINLPKQ